MHDDQMITIFAEDDHAMMVQARGDQIEEEIHVPTSSYDLITLQSADQITEDKWPNASMMIAKVMIRSGFRMGHGLGRYLQGIVRPVEIPFKMNTFGLGFHPNAQQLWELRDA